MYEFVDRPVARLGPGGRFVLWAMRGWIHAAGNGRCPPGALAPAFARHGVLPALPHVHTLLAELNRRARRKIAFAPLAHCTIGDDEAVLLQISHDADACPSRARATLSLLLEEDAVENAFGALLTAVGHLREGGLGKIGMKTTGMAGPP